MASAVNRKIEDQSARRRFRGEQVVAELTGFSVRTLQKDRLLGRQRFPWYKVGGKVLYDLDEVEAIIRASLMNGGAAA